VLSPGFVSGRTGGMSEVRKEQDRLRADGVLDNNGDRIIPLVAPLSDMGLNHHQEISPNDSLYSGLPALANRASSRTRQT
jgi:hypothetical protein